uniref:Uncharacterized protein n=1 Tax=Anguilla anguilla TaxID=7936 RepID=A0A0E9UIV7_ANGAN
MFIKISTINLNICKRFNVNQGVCQYFLFYSLSL